LNFYTLLTSVFALHLNTKLVHKYSKSVLAKYGNFWVYRFRVLALFPHCPESVFISINFIGSPPYPFLVRWQPPHRVLALLGSSHTQTVLGRKAFPAFCGQCWEHSAILLPHYTWEGSMWRGVCRTAEPCSGSSPCAPGVAAHRAGSLRVPTGRHAGDRRTSGVDHVLRPTP